MVTNICDQTLLSSA